MKNKKLIAGLSIVLIILVNICLFKVILDKTIDLVEVPISKEEIKPRTQITSNMIEFIEVPSIYVSDDVLILKEDILDKYTEIEGIIPKGSLFYKTMLYEETELPDYPALKLKENQNVFTLSTDLLKSSGNSFVSNQSVDLHVTIEKKKENPVTDLLLSSVRVLNVIDRKGNDMKDSESNIPYLINLAVDNEYIGLLKMASEVGVIDLYATTFPQQDECILYEESKILTELGYEIQVNEDETGI